MRYKKLTIKTMTESEVVVRNCMLDIADMAVEQSGWREELVSEEQFMIDVAVWREKQLGEERQNCLKQLSSFSDVMDLAGYEGDVQLREKKEKAARERRQGSTVEMRTIERMIRGQKRKMTIQLSPEEKSLRNHNFLLECAWSAVEEMVKTAALISWGKSRAVVGAMV